MTREDKLEIIIFLTVVICAAVGWYCLWVVPHNEFLHAVMDCMADIGDRTEEGYNICAERVSG